MAVLPMVPFEVLHVFFHTLLFTMYINMNRPKEMSRSRKKAQIPREAVGVLFTKIRKALQCTVEHII